MPVKMKAAILNELNTPLIVDDVGLPEKLDIGQSLVRVHYSGICGSQLGEIAGVKGPDRFLPHLLGHEGAGEIVSTGPGVRRFEPGDRVVLHWRKGEGLEGLPPKYSWKGKQLNAGFVTTFNEYAVVSENRLTRIPEGLPMDIAPLMGCAVTTGLGVVNNNAGIRIGESVVIFGAGGVGLNMIQGAAMCSAYPVVAVDLYENRLKKALECGATHSILARENIDVKQLVLEAVGSSGADVVIDNTGNTDMISLGYDITKNNGRTVLVGVPKKGDRISVYSLDLHFEKVLTGSHGGETDPNLDIPRYANLYANGKLKLDHLITDRFPLEDINIAVQKMRNGDVSGRCLIDMRPK